MELTHVSIHPVIDDIQPTHQDMANQIDHPGFKPVGFWYEVDADWRRWCLEEEWGLEGDRYLHRLELGDEKMLKLSTAAELDTFTAKFGADQISSGAPLGAIEWGFVATQYDGMQIAPYIWSRRLQLTWYYGWDCASGVIWRPRGAKLTPIGPLERPIRPENDQNPAERV